MEIKSTSVYTPRPMKTGLQAKGKGKVAGSPSDSFTKGSSVADSKMKDLEALKNANCKTDLCATGEIGGALLKMGGCVLAGITGGAVAGAMMGSAGGPVVAALSGVLGGIVGGAAGAVAGYKIANR